MRSRLNLCVLNGKFELSTLHTEDPQTQRVTTDIRTPAPISGISKSAEFNSSVPHTDAPQPSRCVRRRGDRVHKRLVKLRVAIVRSAPPPFLSFVTTSASIANCVLIPTGKLSAGGNLGQHARIGAARQFPFYFDDEEPAGNHFIAFMKARHHRPSFLKDRPLLRGTQGKAMPMRHSLTWLVLIVADRAAGRTKQPRGCSCSMPNFSQRPFAR